MTRLLIAFLFTVGCQPSPNSPRGTTDASKDSSVADVTVTIDAKETGTDLRASRTFSLERTQPPTSLLGKRRSYDVVRGLIHAHSVHSHDACDGEPELENGEPNEPCLQDFRNAICTTRQDYVFLTEHEGLAAFHEFDELSLVRGDDQPIVGANGRIVGNRITCENGHESIIIPGGEFSLMPIGLTDHLPGTADERDMLYGEVTPERVQSYKDLGAVVLQGHAESRDRDELRQLNLDGFEVYQLHANVDPDIRADWLGLDRFGFVAEALPFIQNKTESHPDLVFLTFVAPNQPSVSHFDALVAEGQHLTGTGGTDCHQNVFQAEMSDGERVDGYRRMMRWFSNHLLVDDTSPDSLRAAVRDGRLAIVFEIFGTPKDHDFRAQTATTTTEMGESVSLGVAPMIIVENPTVIDWGPVQTHIELFKIESTGGVVVAETDSERLEFTVTEPGAYRAVISITPTHLLPHLFGDYQMLAEQTYEWIWFNPIYVNP